MNDTILYMLTENSPYMMSFVICTSKNNVIVIDGGRAGDMPLLKHYIGGRHISAWILTHAHSDHISGFVDEIRKMVEKTLTLRIYIIIFHRMILLITTMCWITHILWKNCRMFSRSFWKSHRKFRRSCMLFIRESLSLLMNADLISCFPTTKA